MNETTHGVLRPESTLFRHADEKMKLNNLLNQSRSLTSCRFTWVVRPGTAFRRAPYTHSVADVESLNSFFAPDCCISQGGVTTTGSPEPVIECEGAFPYRREIQALTLLLRDYIC